MPAQEQNNNFAGMTIDVTQQDHLRDSLILFLRQAFKDHPAYKWSSDEQESKIDIIDEFSFNRSTIGRRPAIVIMRGGTRHIQLGIHHLKSIVLADDITKHEGMVEAGMRVSCYSKLPVESEAIASLVFDLFRFRKYDIMEMTGMFQFQTSSVSPRSVIMATSAPELTETSIDLTIQYVETWTHTEKSTKIGGFIEREPEVVDP